MFPHVFSTSFPVHPSFLTSSTISHGIFPILFHHFWVSQPFAPWVSPSILPHLQGFLHLREVAGHRDARHRDLGRGGLDRLGLTHEAGRVHCLGAGIWWDLTNPWRENLTSMVGWLMWLMWLFDFGGEIWSERLELKQQNMCYDLINADDEARKPAGLTLLWDGSCKFPLQRNSGIAAVGSGGIWLTESPSKYQIYGCSWCLSPKIWYYGFWSMPI